MRLRKTIKRIVALGTGATMMGATLMGAMAADLANYPTPFIKDGAFSGALVIGNNAAAEDVIGVSDIAVSLQFAATKTTGTTTGTESVVTGDVFRISASGDELNILESLSDVKDAVDRSSLDALKSGVLTNDKGTYTYDQYIMLGNSSVQYVISEESGVLEDPQLYLKITADQNSNSVEDGTEVFRIKLTFPTAAKSDVDSSCDLDDLDNKKLTILGKEYTITNTDYDQDTAPNGKLTIEMMGGAVTDTLEEGESKTYTINGVNYETRVDTITDTSPYKVKFTINGEVTDALSETETFTLADKTQIGIKELLPNEAGDVTGDVVTFYLGAKKLKLVDTNSSAANANGELTVGTNDITDGQADLIFTNSSSSCGSGTLSLSTLQIAWQSGDTFYVPIGGKLSEHVEDDDDVIDLLSALNIDFEFAGMKPVNTDDIKITASGTTNLKLKMKNKGGDSISEELWYYNSSNTRAFLGKDANRPLVTTEDTSNFLTYGDVTDKPLSNFTGVGVSDEDFFVVETNKYSHLMQVKKLDSTNTEVTLKDVGTGKTEKVTVTSGVATFYKDGYEYQLGGLAAAVDYNNATMTKIAGDSGDDRADLWTEFGAQIILFDNATIISEGPTITRDDESPDSEKTNITIMVNAVSSKLTPSSVQTNSPIYNDIDFSTETKDLTISLDSDSDKEAGYTVWGSLVEQDTSGDQDTIDITYPEKEAIANVYLTAGVTQKVTGTSEGSDTVTIQRIEVGATKLASEIAGQEITQNVILVGGPCANSAAAVVMGNPADCAAGFEAGKALIQLFENDGNVAMLVAGYSAADTRAATGVIANYGDYVLTGEKMEVTTATSTVKAVTMAAE